MNKGDVVRLTYTDGMIAEGRVSYAGSTYFTLDGRFSVYPDDDMTYTLEVLHKAMPEEPPVGSIVEYVDSYHGKLIFVRTDSDDEQHWLWISKWSGRRVADTWAWLCENNATVKYWHKP